MANIYHITIAEDWYDAKKTGHYQVESLDTEGFIHCSTAAQLIAVANGVYAGQTGLLFLAIDETRLPAEVVYEDCYQTGQKFPHIYGVVPLSAIVNVVDFPPGKDGKFSLPVTVK